MKKAACLALALAIVTLMSANNALAENRAYGHIEVWVKPQKGPMTKFYSNIFDYCQSETKRSTLEKIAAEDSDIVDFVNSSNGTVTYVALYYSWTEKEARDYRERQMKSAGTYSPAVVKTFTLDYTTYSTKCK